MSNTAAPGLRLPPILRTDAQGRARAQTVGEVLLTAARESADQDAVVFRDARWSYGELAERARTLARGLIGLGTNPGDRVGVLMANSPDTVAAMYAIALARGVFVPINIRYRAVELPFVVADAGLTSVISSDRIDDYVDLVGLMGEAMGADLTTAPDPEHLRLVKAPSLRQFVVLGNTERQGCVSERMLLRRAADVSDVELQQRHLGVRVRDDALVLYTSGTTSLPRGCRLSHEAITRNWACVAEILDIRKGDRVWAPCPLFHLAAIGPMLACSSAHAAFVSDTFFEPRRAVELIAAERPTHLYPAYPPITQALLAAPGFSDLDTSSVRATLNVAPAKTLLSMQEALPDAVQLSLYGSTEGGGAITYNSLQDDLETRTTTCGLPLPGCEVRVIDPETGEDRRVEQDGEILVRSFGLFGGYLNDPEKTNASFDADGWYRTGDRGSLDAHGRLRFLGRLKDMLKVGGENVAPAEIESLLMTHPSVLLAVVVGVPDPRLEEVPVAFVELRPDAQKVTPDELVQFCDGRLARFKVPRHVRIIAEWPMSATKVQKGQLRNVLLAELEG